VKYYTLFRSLDGSAYKAKSGTDGITEDDMRGLRRVVKRSQKAMAKGNRLDTVSIELVTEDGWQEVDVAVIVEEQDEYQRLHKAIATLPPEHQTLIHKVYFQGISQREIARAEGVTEGAIRDRLKRIYKKLKIFLD